MNKYHVWDPDSESEQDARLIEADDVAGAAKIAARQVDDENGGETFMIGDSVLFHVRQIGTAETVQYRVFLVEEK